MGRPPDEQQDGRRPASDRSEWISFRTVLWVLDEAPNVPPSLVAPLVGLARHADADGSNAYPSEATLSRYTRKTIRQVRRDLAELLKLGLIRRPLDQSAASGHRADRRPTVYDLACAPNRPHGQTPTTGRECPGGHLRPVVDAARPDMWGGTTGHVGQHDRTPMSSEQSLKKTEQQQHAREANPLAESISAAIGCTGDQAVAVITDMEADQQIAYPAGLVRHLLTNDRDALRRRLDRIEGRKSVQPIVGRRTPDLPAACGQCDARSGDAPNARRVWLDAERTRSAPCPRCSREAANSRAP